MSSLKKLHNNSINDKKCPYTWRKYKMQYFDAIVDLVREKPGLTFNEIEAYYVRWGGGSTTSLKEDIKKLKITQEIEEKNGKYYIKGVK